MNQVKSVRVLVMPGAAIDGVDVQKAIRFLDDYDDASTVAPANYAVVIRCDGGCKIEGEFRDKASAVEFLQVYQT